jgi:adenine phosphoribosyltransferase
MIDFKELINNVEDFPKKGVTFRDITPLLASPKYFSKVIDELSLILDENFEGTRLVSGIEARGFILGASIASLNGYGFIPIRKEGKLPPPKVATYSKKEYGVDMLEVKESSIYEDIIIIDDVLATGGTLTAAEHLLNNAGYNVIGAVTLIDLSYLHEEILIGGREVISLIKY